VADDAVHVILGDQWDYAVPLMRWLGIFGALTAIQSTIAGHILIVLNRERSVFVITWARLILFGGSVLLAASIGTVVDIAMAATLSTAAIVVACVFYLPTALPVSGWRILLQLLRLFLTSLLMYVAVRYLHSTEIGPHWVTLIIDSATGAAIFSSILYLSWIAAGRPDGPEKRLLQLASDRLRRLTKRR